MKKAPIMYHIRQIRANAMKKTDWQTIQKTPLFQAIEEDTLRTLLSGEGVSTATIRKGDVIYDPVHFQRSLAVILKGEARVSKDGGDGHRVTMSTLRQGAIFGMAALFYEGDVFLTEIRAEKNCTILFLSKKWLIDAFRREPTLANNYITLLSERIHFLNQRIADFTGASAAEKLRSFLLSHAERFGDCYQMILPYSMTELAKVINVGRASLYRAFQQLEEENVIKRDGKTVTLNIDKKSEGMP